MTLEEHLLHLREVLECLREAGLTASLSKSCLFLESVKYFGIGVSGLGLSTDLSKVQAVVSYPAPKNRKELDRFLGMCGWFGRFIPEYSMLAESLFQLRRKNVEWSWGASCQAAFEALKDKLCSAPVLAHPNFDKDFELHTDASGVGLGAALHQCLNGTLRTIGFSSRTLSVLEGNYSTVEREILAVV
jgi:hypothetical protein